MLSMRCGCITSLNLLLNSAKYVFLFCHVTDVEIQKWISSGHTAKAERSWTWNLAYKNGRAMFLTIGLYHFERNEHLCSLRPLSVCHLNIHVEMFTMHLKKWRWNLGQCSEMESVEWGWWWVGRRGWMQDPWPATVEEREKRDSQRHRAEKK